jgi:hypothetical protein
MQASAIETKLPRALVRRNAELLERFGGPVNQKPETEPEATTNVVTTVEPPAQPAADPRENDPAYWKQRFTVTSGILRSERDDRKVEKATLNQRITELEAELQAARTGAPDLEGDLGEFFTPEQIEEMGETAARATYNAIKKQVKDQVSAALKPMTTQAEAAKADEAADRKNAFLDKLIELVPSYEEIDSSDEWKEWLAEDDEGTGIKRQAILDKHVVAFNATRVAKMFKEYLQTQDRPTPPVAPHGTAATPSTTLPKATTLIAPSRDEIKDFYKRAALGKVKPKEAAEFEARMALLKK